MKAENLGVVFGPSMLHDGDKTKAFQDMGEAAQKAVFQQKDIITYFINNYKDIFVKKERK